ncbi:MAG: ROK family protein [Chloroflexi bacterium HGW-Chloroflexi-1]|nr:MAG: ROK family protein [Chloroflexi bacterium HGW-Chloroflexi-1]
MGKGISGKPVVGVDLGGTKILAGVVAADGQILGMAKRATKPEGGPEVVVARIVKTVRKAVEAAKLDMSDIAAVASGAPGPLDPDQGIIWNAPNLAGWENFPLADRLSERLEMPVCIENDVNLGTLGEYALGAGRGARDVVGIFVGTGIGGGLILDGVLRQGFRKAAAEIGHMIVLADGPACGCGNRGCVEAVASRTAIERDILAGIDAGRESLIPAIMQRDSRDRLTSGALAEAFRGNDPLVTEVIGKAQFYLGLLVASVVNFVDPEVVIFGGGVTEALGEDFLAPIRRVAYQCFINKRGAEQVKIVLAQLGDNAVLLGAAVLARRRLGKDGA